MNCNKCDKVLAITRTLKPTEDAIVCRYCNTVVDVKNIVWSDGKFHFNIMGEVPVDGISPKIILNNQVSKEFDAQKILSRAQSYVKSEPNLKARCGEFGITDNDMQVVLLHEEKH